MSQSSKRKMNKKGQMLVIKLNNSEALAFTGCFGLIFSIPNIKQIFLENMFPTIIETATINVGLFKFLYVLASIFLIYETYHWIIQLINMMEKTSHLRINYNLYLIKVSFFGILGFFSANLLNNLLF